MSITYQYKIVAVDEAARCMEIVYSAEGRQTMHIGARLPFEGETLEAIVRMYSPLTYWLQQERTVQLPLVGDVGEIVPPIIPPIDPIEEAKQANKNQAKQLLLESDWADFQSVRNINNTPHLVNGEEFDAYRLALRAIAVNPPVEVSSWPIKPNPIWS